MNRAWHTSDLRVEQPPAMNRHSFRSRLSITAVLLAAGILASAPSSSAADEPSQAPPFWAFQPPRRPPVPLVHNAGRVRNPIDAFVLAALEKQGLTFSPAADRLTLLRRASFDLIGLPPSPEEIEAFLADQSPDAYERLIERLLASTHYGERWGRH